MSQLILLAHIDVAKKRGSVVVLWGVAAIVTAFAAVWSAFEGQTLFVLLLAGGTIWCAVRVRSLKSPMESRILPITFNINSNSLCLDIPSSRLWDKKDYVDQQYVLLHDDIKTIRVNVQGAVLIQSRRVMSNAFRNTVVLQSAERQNFELNFRLSNEDVCRLVDVLQAHGYAVVRSPLSS